MPPPAHHPLELAEALEHAYRLAMALESLAQAQAVQARQAEHPENAALWSLSSELLDVLDRSRAALVCACAGRVR